jgi:2-polyprenyl-3-methyl-5-hydroxy-6-metoxy-1,4-benzoquinol methylase
VFNFFLKIFKSALLSIINNPELNVKIQYSLRPVKRHKIILAELLREIPQARVLDYGCGEGFFADCFESSKYYGYDLEQWRIAYAKEHFPQYTFSAEKPELKNFDVVFFNNVWHHLSENQIKALLQEMTVQKIILIELKPSNEQRGWLFKLILWLEANLHYSNPRKSAYYIELLKSNGFALRQNKDLGRFFLQVYSLTKV